MTPRTLDAIVRRDHQHGAGLVGFVVVAPTLLALTMAILQTGLAFHAKSSLNYAGFEAARAGSLAHADPTRIRLAFTRAMTAYYGGGRNAGELAAAARRAHDDLAGAVRIEILSPSKESFDDFHSPAAAHRLGTAERVIPSAALAHRRCPPDRPGCAADPAHNRSAQTLADANLLKLRLTWGIPRAKQMPLAGRFFTWALRTLDADDRDAFRSRLLAAGRIPLVSHVTVRMQSDAIESGAIVPRPVSGGGDTPIAPGTPAPPEPLPPCGSLDPLCTEPKPPSPPIEEPVQGGDAPTPPSDDSGDLPCP
ncbi:MAG: pilus assembly protein [Thauera phenolivorans]|uniref:Pilus assembly protein n=1 Tax=Thauera phenolivorans TaxID=1792543 RepID=A0A7X7LUN7_9RHOO|nr:pilus assembly protein [Thauera phenolivorans]